MIRYKNEVTNILSNEYQREEEEKNQKKGKFLKNEERHVKQV